MLKPNLRSRFTVFLLSALVAAVLGGSEAWAIRAVPWLPGGKQVIIIKTALGQLTEIVFPAPLVYLTHPSEEAMTVQEVEERAYLYPRQPLPTMNLYGKDEAGRTYVFEIQQVEPPDRQDDSVEISVAAPEEAPGPMYVGPTPQVIRLIVAMTEEKPVPGYQIHDAGGELFLEEVKLTQWRLARVYEGVEMLGLVVDVENVSNEAIRLDPQQLRVKGLRGATITDQRLAPHEPADSVEAFKGYPKRTKAYVVVNRAAFTGGSRTGLWDDRGAAGNTSGRKTSP
ncbi:MAG: type-F conjugative transfer system secretin TraK [Nitrospirae bacterium]|nr:type-F conjugative transfer system secretin TraK [Nitrospirota bacterium]